MEEGRKRKGIVGEKMAVQMTLNNRQASQRKLQEKVDSPTTILLHTLTATPMGIRDPALSSICSPSHEARMLHMTCSMCGLHNFVWDHNHVTFFLLIPFCQFFRHFWAADRRDRGIYTYAQTPYLECTCP